MEKCITRSKKIVKEHSSLIIICIFLGMYLFGLTFIKNVGISYDEYPEQVILKMNIMQYAKSVSSDSDLVRYYKDNGITPIYYSVEKDHGVSPYYIFAPFLLLNKVSNNLFSISWHLYTYSLTFLGVLFLYFLVKELFNNRKIALFSSALLFLTPKLFIDGMYNNKDCVLMAFVIISLYFGIRFIKDKSYKNAVFLGIFSAIACNLKISVFFIFAMIGLFYLIDLTFNKNWSWKNFKIGCTAILIFLILYILITPAIWGEGFHLVEFFKWNLENTTKFQRWDGEVFFEGNIYRNLTHPLPWYYLPKMILITIPIIVSILFVLSIIIFGYKRIKRLKLEKNEFYFLMFILIVFIPILTAMITYPNIYNGWRHFYFLYGPIIILTSYSIYYLNKKEKIQFPMYSILILILCFNLCGIIKNGVYSTGYYNLLAGKNVYKNYELDYYGVTTRKTLKLLVNHFNQDKLYIYAKGDCLNDFKSLINNFNSLSNAYKERITILSNEEEYSRVFEEGLKPLFLVNPTYKRKEYDENKKVYDYKSWGNVIFEIYEGLSINEM